MGALADKIAGKTTMFGKTYNTVGSSDSNFIIKTKGDLKIQWGNKYIDVIKNGKIVSNDISIFYMVETKDDIKNDGIYLVGENLLWLSIKGQLFNIPMDETESSGTSYISFLVDQLLKSEEKHRALTNIGFYYQSLNDVKDITSGLVYIEETLKLYIINKGVLTPYYTVDKTDLSEISNTLDELWVGPLHLYLLEGYGIIDSSVNMMISQESIPYLILEDETVKVQSSLQMSSDSVLMSENANDYYGYKLYVENEISTLEVDNIIWRKHPTLITYKELKKRMDEKTLAPKLYYLITDFLNPWEVTWDEEPLYYENEYKEIDEEQYLINFRNALLLIVRAANEELLEELAWSPLHPEWVIHYDPYFLGEKQIITENNILYGYRSRRNASNEIEFLSCKGVITYLKDEFNNEGNFNFRHHRFKKDIYDDVKNVNATVWRYCIDKNRISDSTVIYGEFFSGKNNKFFFEHNQTYNLLVQIILELDNDGKVVNYLFVDIEPNLILSRGLNLTIYGNNIEDNTFEINKELPIKNSVIDGVNYLINNHFKDVCELTILSCDTVINNKIENIEKVDIMNSTADNIIIGVDKHKPAKFNIPRGLIFNKNHLENFNGLEDFRHIGVFEENNIINSKITLKNIEIDSISSGSIGNFIKNNINNSEVQLLVSDKHTKIFENNIILSDSKLTITNYGTISDNDFSLVKGIIKNNDGSILGNTITNNQELNIVNNSKTIDDVVNVSIIENNSFENVKVIQNESTIINNIIKDSGKINNTGIIENNNFIISQNLINSGTILDNIINKATLILNSGKMTNNKINEVQKLTLSKNFSNNNINNILKDIQINNAFTDNKINDIDSFTISADITNNTIINIDGCVIKGSMKDNSFKNIKNVTFLNSVENNLFNGDLLDCSFSKGVISNVSYKNITSMTVTGDLKYCIFTQNINNFSVVNMEHCTLEEINNLFFTHSIYNTTFHGLLGDVTRSLPTHELDLLKDKTKKTEIFPNIEVISVPEILLTGMIIMWHGNKIPKGWHICNGEKGTPDLRGLFVKSAKSTNDVGFSNNDHLLEGTNKIKLSEKQLPEHSHPHKNHTHSISNLSASTERSTVSVSSSGSFFNSKGTADVSSEIEGVSPKTVVGSVDASTVYSSGGSHTHVVNLSGSLESVPSEEKEWQYGPQQSILLEPRHYKIIFIMKIDEGIYPEE